MLVSKMLIYTRYSLYIEIGSSILIFSDIILKKEKKYICEGRNYKWRNEDQWDINRQVLQARTFLW